MGGRPHRARCHIAGAPCRRRQRAERGPRVHDGVMQSHPTPPRARALTSHASLNGAPRLRPATLPSVRGLNPGLDAHHASNIAGRRCNSHPKAQRFDWRSRQCDMCVRSVGSFRSARSVRRRANELRHGTTRERRARCAPLLRRVRVVLHERYHHIGTLPGSLRLRARLLRSSHSTPP